MNRRTFLTEIVVAAAAVPVLASLPTLPATTSNKKICIPILTVDTPNGNNRIYPRGVIEREIKRVRENYINVNRWLVSNKLPESKTICLCDTIGIIKKVDLQGNRVMAEVEFFPNGSFYEDGIRNGNLHLRTSGIGSVSRQSDGTYKVQDDFELLSCFITNEPA